MSTHSEIEQVIRSVIGGHQTEGLRLRPTAIALDACGVFSDGKEDPHIRYLAVEHAKQMARRVLSNKFDAEGEENEAHQGDMFSGHLQEHYPLPRTASEEPIYAPRDSLSGLELDWNIKQLRKSADARLRHADALQAYRDDRGREAA